MHQSLYVTGRLVEERQRRLLTEAAGERRAVQLFRRPGSPQGPRRAATALVAVLGRAGVRVGPARRGSAPTGSPTSSLAPGADAA